jgi:hypothetical protein
MIQLAARGVLLIFALWAASLVFEPNHDARRLEVEADSLEHALIAFGLTIMASAALPKVNLLLISAAVLGLGLGLEALQLAQVVPGRFEVRDLVANLVGVGIALLAVGIGEARGSRPSL